MLLRGKGGKQRIVPVGRPALAAVDAYAVRARPALAARGRGTPALLLNARGGRLSRQSAWHVLRQAAETAGLSTAVSPHTLRHCFATHLLAGGADVRVVQELLGHASVSTTQIYTHVTVDTLREVYATLAPAGPAAEPDMSRAPRSQRHAGRHRVPSRAHRRQLVDREAVTRRGALLAVRHASYPAQIGPSAGSPATDRSPHGHTAALRPPSAAP